jgi:hypothetical protein
MDQEDGQRIERLFHSALEHEPERRQTFLDAECGGDPELRSLVELLLAKNEDTATFHAVVPDDSSYLIPLPRGHVLPPVPTGGFHSEQQISELPGARRSTLQWWRRGPLLTCTRSIGERPNGTSTASQFREWLSFSGHELAFGSSGIELVEIIAAFSR